MSRRSGIAVMRNVVLFLLLLAVSVSPALAGEEPGGGAREATQPVEGTLAQSRLAAGGALAQPSRTAGLRSVLSVSERPTQPSRTAGLRSVLSVSERLTQLPLYFIENRGQIDERVAYYVQGKDKALYFTPQGLTFVLPAKRLERERKEGGGSTQGRELSHEFPRVPSAPWAGEAVQLRWAVKLDFVGANPEVQPAGLDETGAVVSYFRGAPEEWVTGLKTYSTVVYRDLWPGIDLLYSGTVDRLKYRFEVQPGADPAHIQLAYRGADIAVNEQGQMEVSTPAGGFRDGAPYAYQQAEGGEQVAVDVSYDLLPTSHERQTYGFRVGAYDRSRVLVVDPVVLFRCGYVGGNMDDHGLGIALDSEGSAYITGYTLSSESSFPDTVGPDRTHNSGEDAFVAKVRVDGGGLSYCGYIGGSDNERGMGIAVDDLGRAYIAGYSYSSSTEGFPVLTGPDVTYNGSGEAFVARVAADGTLLEYCGYIGGIAEDWGRAIAVDGYGHAFVTGHTASTADDHFPVTVGPDLTHNGGVDAFVADVSASGASLFYCGYIGGAQADYGHGIALDAWGAAYVTGETNSDDLEGFPATVGPDLYHNGLIDGFVAKVHAGGASLDYCGYIGGDDFDYGYGITVDGGGRAYVTGQTGSDEGSFPVAVGPDLSYNGGWADAFLARLSADGASLDYCGYIGGSDADIGEGVAVDDSGYPYVAGETASSEAEAFPVSQAPDVTYNGGDRDAFLARVSTSGGGLLYCGYIGGADTDRGTGVAVDGALRAYVVGSTHSSHSEGFPTTVGPDLTYNGVWDAFVARIGTNHAPTLGTITPSSGSSPAGGSAPFITSWRDEDGWRDLKHCYFHIGASPALPNNVTLMYNRIKNKLWIRSDDGTTWLGGCTPGDNVTIENSQASLFCLLSSHAYTNPDELRVTWWLVFKPGFEGTKKTGLKCKDAHKAKAKGAWKGNWTITPAASER
jgi:hypothetical protein